MLPHAETCALRDSQIHRLAEDELGFEETARLNEHLQGCPQCSRKLREFRETKALIEKTLTSELTLPGVTELVASLVSQICTCK